MVGGSHGRYRQLAVQAEHEVLEVIWVAGDHQSVQVQRGDHAVYADTPRK
jgi:hypothetical protein